MEFCVFRNVLYAPSNPILILLISFAVVVTREETCCIYGHFLSSPRQIQIWSHFYPLSFPEALQNSQWSSSWLTHPPSSCDSEVYMSVI
ncbi:hypothetical protein ACTXT7_014013 [Hymenolepis weldensis]